MSKSCHNKLIQAVDLMLDYMDANQHYFSSPKAFFESFAESMHSGTIGEEGYDPSGLYWLPKRTTTAYNLLYSITQFSDWLAENALLKHQTTLTIDMRDMRLQQRESLPSGSTEVLAAKVEGLLPTEISSLEHAVSEEFLSHQGWIPDTQGRVKKEGHATL